MRVSCEIITRTLFRLPDTLERNLTAGPSAGEGVINLLTSSHAQVRSDVVAAMRRLAEVLGSCASALDASVKMYDSTDRGSAEQLDSTCPNPGIRRSFRHCQVESFKAAP